jgi:hypothetical protein
VRIPQRTRRSRSHLPRSRSRKIKCVTDAGQTSCTACARHNSPCTYNARTKYYADRERQVATRIAPGGVSTTSGSLAGGSSIISFSYATFSPSRRRTQALTPSRRPSAVPPTPAANMAAAPRPLFEAAQPEFPQVALMPYYIELFFKHYARACPAVAYDAVVGAFLHSTLAAPLSCALAALAARHAGEMHDLAGVDARAAPDAYANAAKRAIQTAPPVLDTLHATVLVAFHEHVCGRRDGLAYYAQQAAHMLRALRLDDDNVLRATSRSMEEYQQMLALRATVQQLYSLASQR